MIDFVPPKRDLAIEVQILKTITQGERTYGKVSTRTIASRVHLSMSQTWRYLRELEAQGYVQRVGQRGGWKRAA